MFLVRERHVAADRPCPVDHADVFVRGVDAMDVEKARRDESARAGLSRGRAFAEEFYVEAAFLLRLAQRGDFRILVQFNVPAERKPFAELAMQNQQHLRVVDDEDGNGEINLLMEVRHGARTVSRARAGVNGPGIPLDKPALLFHPRAMSKPALGRGLSALLGGGAAAAKPAAAPAPAAVVAAPKPALPAPPPGEVVQTIAVARVRPCAFQPRKDFAEDALRELADSIRAQGILSPLIVRARGESFEIIAGERRWRAAQLAGLSEVPVIVREADDRAVLELALIENLQRENLNPIEEALGYAQLIEQFQLTQETAATKVGKSRAVVANALRLLKLAPELQGYLRHGQLSVGHAKVILGLAGLAEQKLAAERVLKDGLNVRQTEDLVARLQHSSTQAPTKTTGSAAAAPRDVHVARLETKLQERFGTKVALRYRKGKGAVEIRFFNDDDLERILQVAGVPMD